MKRIITTLLIIAALAFAGCGGVGHAVGGVIVHKVTNHLVKSAKGKRNVNKVFCLYHGHRVIVDIKHHHLIGAGINAVEAYKSCKAGFGKH